MENLIVALREAVLVGDHVRTEELCRKGLEQGLDPLWLINEGLVAGMNEVGQKFEANEYFVPDLLVAARAMKAGLSVVLPQAKVGRESAGRVAIGTVAGDIHDIGKNIVATLLETAGFEVIDVGVDVPVSRFVEVAPQVDVIGMSALLTFTMPGMGDVIEALRKEGLRERVKVIVGGAPVSAEFARKIGADGYAEDGVRAVRKVRELMRQGGGG